MDGFSGTSKSLVSSRPILLHRASSLYNNLRDMKEQSLAVSQIIDEVLTATDRPVSQIVQQCTNRINRMFSLNPEVKQRFLFNIGHTEELGVIRSWLLMEGYRDFFLPLLGILKF